MIFALLNAGATLLVAPIWTLFAVRNWLVPLLFGTAFVFVVLPIQANQDVFWRNGQQMFQTAVDTWDTIRGVVNPLWLCVARVPVTWNRVAAVYHALLIVLADVLDYDLPRDASGRNIPVVVDTYCAFVRTVSDFLVLFMRLLYAAIRALIKVIGAAITAFAQIKDLSFVDLLIELGTTVFEDLLGLRVCFRSWQGVLFCLCRGRWDSPFDVPSVVTTAFAMCLNPDYDGRGDPIAGGLAPIFGALRLYQARDAAVAAYQGLLNGIAQIASVAQTVISKLAELEGAFSTLENIKNSITKAFEDLIEDIGDLLGLDAQRLSQREMLREYFAALEASTIMQQEMILAAYTFGDTPRGTPARREAARAFVQNVTTSIAAAFLAELPRVWNDTLAEANITAEEAGMWFKVLGVVSEVLSGNQTAHEIADRMRAAGVDFRPLARKAPPCRKPTEADRARSAMAQIAAMAPRFVPEDSSWLTIALGTVVILSITLVLSLTSPAGVALVLGWIGLTAFSIILPIISGNALHIASAVATGQFDQALGVGTYLYAANYVGREYMRGGLINVDANAFVSGLVNELRKDAVYSLQMGLDIPTCTGLVTPFCLPPPIRGENPIDRVLAALRCEQNAPCTTTYTVADCPGRARSCVAGKCLCWLYLPEFFELPKVNIVYNQPLDCRAFGYTTDGLTPAQTGGFAWINLWSNTKNVWAGAGDLLAQIAHNQLPYSVLAVAPAAFLPIVGPAARKMTTYAIVALGAQLALVYVNGYLGWIAPRDHGWSCMVANSGSLVLGAMVGSVAYALLMAATIGGVLSAFAGVVFAALVLLGRGSTLLLRWSRPYEQWYRSNREAGEDEQSPPYIEKVVLE